MFNPVHPHRLLLHQLRSWPTLPPTWCLVAALACGGSPGGAAAQQLDSAQVADLIREADRDLSQVPDLAAHRWIRPSLERSASHLGVELLPLPDTDPVQGNSRVWFDQIFNYHGKERALAEAAALDEERGVRMWTNYVHELITLEDGGASAMWIAFDGNHLPGALHSILSGSRRAHGGTEAVISWIEDTDLPEALRSDLWLTALSFAALYDPQREWDRSRSLPSYERAVIGLRALGQPTSLASIPVEVADSFAAIVLADIRSLEGRDTLALLRGLTAVCVQRQIGLCDAEGLEDRDTHGLASRFINHMGNGEWAAALDRLESLRALEAPSRVARVMAEALEGTPSRCSWKRCEMRTFDSLFIAWMPEIDRIEAAGTGEEAEQTRLALAKASASRDLNRTRGYLSRMTDQGLIDSALFAILQSALDTDLIGTVELYLEFASPTASVTRAPYVELIRAGRQDLADQMLAAMHSTQRFEARLSLARLYMHTGQTIRATDLVSVAIEDWDIDHPLLAVGGLTQDVQNMGLVETYLAHVRSNPDPAAPEAGPSGS